MKFAITGLPRSGHAWLANFFDAGPLRVTHEGARLFHGPSCDMTEAHRVLRRNVAGDCSSTWLLHRDLLLPSDDVVLIRRDPDAVRASLSATPGGAGCLPALDLLVELCDNMVCRRGCLIVDYEPQYSESTLRRICRHLRVPFDPLRYRMLQDYRVTQDVEGVLRRLNANMLQ